MQSAIQTHPKTEKELARLTAEFEARGCRVEVIDGFRATQAKHRFNATLDPSGSRVVSRPPREFVDGRWVLRMRGLEKLFGCSSTKIRTRVVRSPGFPKPISRSIPHTWDEEAVLAWKAQQVSE